MKKYLISEKGNFYKANLHCHTTVSDAQTTPEETKEAYKNAGYSIIAFTDHDKMVCHNDLTDDTFLALNGYEADVTQPNPRSGGCSRVCHICVIALDKNTTEVPEWKCKTYSGESISAFMKENSQNNFFVTYNHPSWSLESYPQYMSYKGATALEIMNYGCVSGGYDDRNTRVYDDMLRGGERLFAIAADDNHNPKHFFGGYTMIKADELSYEAIAKSLREGNFYASEGGPNIEELYIEDGIVHVKTDGAREISFSTDRRHCALYKGSEAHEFAIGNFDYFRITAVGHDGKCSWTNAYFVDSIN